MVLQDPYLVRPESYQRFETKGLSYPTSSRNKFDAKKTTIGKDILRDMKKTNNYLSNYNR